MTSYTANYSIPSPDGTDGVVVHTDLKKAVEKADEVLKTTNDRVSAAEVEIDEARYYQGATPLPMPPERAPGAPWWDALDLLPTDVYTIWSGPVAERYGFPFNAQCDVTVHRWGATGGTVKVQTREDPPRYFIGSRLSGGWGAGLTELATMEDSAPAARVMLPASPASYKKAATDMTTGYGGAVFSGSGKTVVVQKIHALADMIDVHIRNWNPRYINADRPSVTLSSVRVGRHTGNGVGTEWITLNAGATGTEGYHSETVAVPTAWRGQEVAVEYQWSGTEITRCLGTGWTNGTFDGTPPMFVWIGTRVPASVPVISVISSSSGAGVGATRPLIDSWLAKLATRIGAIATFWANSGDTTLSWLTGAERKYQRYSEEIAAPNMMFYALLSNDWAGGATFAELKDRMHQHISQIPEHVVTPIYGTTVTPRSTPPSNDADRIALNEYMKDSGLFQWVFDFAEALSLTDGTLNPALTADGTHPNDAGHTALEQAVNVPVVISAA